MPLTARHVTLEEGQSWDDLLTVTATRQDWSAGLAVMLTQMTEAREVMEEAYKASKAGDIHATLVLALMMDTDEKVTAIIRKITEVVYPDIAAEADAENKAAETLASWHEDLDR